MGMAGMDEDEDTFAPVLMSTKSRAIWLGLNLVTAFTAAFVSNLFEDTLEKLVSLAILMTIVPSMGGVAGSQTLTLVIRGLALGHIGKNNTRWLVGKELAVGFLNGLLWAAVVAIIATVWKGDWKVGLIIAAAMTANLIVAALSGVGIPLLMKKVGIDPALAGAVVLTTITDVVGLLAFLGLATVFL
jgi:magnesium transporter